MILTPTEVCKFYGMYLSGVRIPEGKRMRICSPFRSEREPSFEINLENGLWYDFGSGEGGDVIGFISRVEGIGIGESLRRYELVMNGVELTKAIRIEGKREVVRSDSGTSMRIYRRDYLDMLHKWDGGVLAGRGIDETTFRKYNGWMWRDDEGQKVLIGYVGVGDEIVDKYKIWVWKRGKKRMMTRGNVTLYPLVNLRYRDIVLCEGEFDCLSVCAGGYHGITGTGGASTFREEWVWALSKKRVCVVYDNDEAGIVGSEQVHSMLNGYAKSVYLHKWEDKPLRYDVGDFINDGGILNGIIKFGA